MFNKKLKEEAIKTLQKAANEYNKQLEDTMCKMEELQEIRDSSVKIINDVNYYKSDLKNSPKEYDTTIAQATSRCDHFNKRIKMLKMKVKELVVLQVQMLLKGAMMQLLLHRRL